MMINTLTTIGLAIGATTAFSQIGKQGLPPPIAYSLIAKIEVREETAHDKRDI